MGADRRHNRLGQDLSSLDKTLALYNHKASQYSQTPMLGMGSIYQQATRNLIELL